MASTIGDDDDDDDLDGSMVADKSKAGGYNPGNSAPEKASS